MLHYTTKSISALKLYTIYKDFGIKNKDFILELMDEKLLNVDPFDVKNLNDELKTRIIVECQRNPWYFFREIVRIPTGGGLIRMKFHRGNAAMLWALLRNLSIFVMLPRQRFKTTTVMILFLWIIYFGAKNTKLKLFAHRDSLLIKNISEIRDIRNALPSYLNFHNKSKDKDNTMEITFSELGNKINKQAPGNSEADADNIGRGESTPIQMYDEYCHIRHIKNQYLSSVLAYSTVAKIAKKNGSPHFKVMSSTAPFLNKPEGSWTYTFLNNCADFDENIFDMKTEDLNNYLMTSSSNGFLRIEYMYYDTDVNSNYFEEQCRELEYDKDAIDREVLNKAKDVTVEHPLGQNLVSGLMDQINKPSFSIVIEGSYIMKFYKKIEEIDFKYPYIGGMDSGGNLQGDFTTLTIVDPRNGEVIATMRTNSKSSMLFARCIYGIMTNLFYSMILIPERNNMGISIIDRILEFNNGALINRVYHSLPNTSRKNKKFSFGDNERKPGFATTAYLRNIFYGELLRVAVERFGHVLHDSHIISEITTLRRNRNGRIDHPQGFHDDAILSYLFCLWFLIFCENNSEYIDKIDIFSKEYNSSISTEKSSEEKLREKRVKLNDKYDDEIRTLELENNNSFDMNSLLSESTGGTVDGIMDKYYNELNDSINEEVKISTEYIKSDISDDEESDTKEELKKEIEATKEKEDVVTNEDIFTVLDL